MKHLFTTAALALCLCVSAFAQNNKPAGNCPPPQDGRGREKMQAEMVSFMTGKIGLTPEEAQAFWPVYNKIEDQQRKLFMAENKALQELRDGLKEENKGKADVNKLLDNYLAAMKANVNLHAINVAEYRAILPAEKVAKFYEGQEAFRRHMIGNLRGPKGGPGQGGPRQGQPGPRNGRGRSQFPQFGMDE